MEKIRVLLANHPMMIPEAIRKLVAVQEEMELVGDCRGPMRILREVGRVKADVVVLAQEGTNESGLCSQLLAIYPDLTLVTVDPNLESTCTQQLRSHRSRVEIQEQGDIVQAIKKAVRDSCGRQQL